MSNAEYITKWGLEVRITAELHEAGQGRSNMGYVDGIACGARAMRCKMETSTACLQVRAAPFVGAINYGDHGNGWWPLGDGTECSDQVTH
jgi:hypothetical protein